MEVSVEQVSAVERKLTLTISAQEVSKAWLRAVRKIGGRVRVPGFRPGKAPVKLLERRYGPAIREDVLDKLLGASVHDAIQAEGLVPISRPQLEELGELRDNNPLDATFTFEVMPTLTVAIDEGAEIAIDVVEADQEDVRLELEGMTQRKADLQEVEGPVEDGDDVLVRLRVTEKGASSEAELDERHIRAGSPTTPAWLVESIAAKRKGESLSHSFEMPQDEAHALAGKACQVEGELVAIKRRIVPDLDDAFAVSMGCDDLAALDDKVSADLAVRARRRSTLLRHKAVLGHLIASNEVTAPATLVDQEITRQLRQIIGGIDPRTSQALAGQIEQLRDRLRPAARQAVEEALVIQNLVDNREVEVADEEVDGRIEEMVQGMEERAAEVRASFAKEEDRQNLRAQMAEEKVLEAVLEKLSTKPGRTLALRDPLVEPPGQDEDEAAQQGTPSESAEPAVTEPDDSEQDDGA